VSSPAGVVPKANDPCWCGSGRKYKRCHRAAAGKVRPGRVGPLRTVPAEIPRPDYADTGRPGERHEPMVKRPEIVEAIRRAGRVAAEVLAVTGAAVRPGVTTDELDAVAHQAYLDRGAYPSTLNYHGYPKSICTSVNEVICHGIPDDRPLAPGDIVNVDVTAYLGGVHGDCSAMFPVGEIDDESAALVAVTRRCRQLGIEAVRPGRPISDIGRAIEDHAVAAGYGVVRTFIANQLVSKKKPNTGW
jgi:methionyl aminopeptidase